MSKMYGNGGAAATKRDEAKNAIKNIILTHGSLFGKKAADEFIGMEALTNKDQQGAIGATVEAVEQLLRSNGAIRDFVTSASNQISAGYLNQSQAIAAAGLENLKEDFRDSTFTRMALSILAHLNPAKTIQGYNKNCSRDGSFTLAHTFGGSGTLASLGDAHLVPSFGMESFDPAVHLDFIAASALINVQSEVPGGFEAVFFPTITLPPGQAGYDIQIQVPKILVTQFRNVSSGAPAVLQKINLVEAAYNPDILTSNAINIVPIATSPTLPAQLVPASLVPTETKNVLGNVVDTRPLIFNKSVPLIELSTFAAIENNGTPNFTDALYTNISIDDVWFKVDITTGIGTTPVTKSVVVKNKVKNYVGALLQQKPIGRVQALQTVTTLPLFLNDSFVPVSGDTNADFKALIQSVLGLSSTDKFTLNFEVRVSSEADTEIGNMNVDANEISLVSANGPTVSGGTDLVYDISAFNTSSVSLTVTPVGWYPDARRTNSNLRTNGTIVDANNIVTYRLPINTFAPFVARAPLNMTDQVTFETLGHLTNLWATGQCVNAMLQMQDWLKMVTGTPFGIGKMTNQCPIMGGEFVIPTYREDLVNLPVQVANFQSKDILVNIRSAIQAALMYNSLQLAMDCGYFPALQMLYADLDAYEVIAVTDPLTAQYLMEAGDTRTFGDNRKYIITKNINKNLMGKIYYSFRVTAQSDLAHPMSFGCKLVSPNITYEVVPMNRDGANMREIQSMPRIVPYVNLPVLGVLNIIGLEAMVSSSM